MAIANFVLVTSHPFLLEVVKHQFPNLGKAIAYSTQKVMILSSDSSSLKFAEFVLLFRSVAGGDSGADFLFSPLSEF